VIFFVDRDLGRGFGLALRSVGVAVVLHDERFQPRTPDHVWIRAVSADGLVILTRDRKIRKRVAERQAFEAAKARCFVIVTGASTPLDDLRALLIAWPKLTAMIDNFSAPFMFGVGREGQLTQYIPATGPAGPAARSRRPVRSS
jgi:hypothetical protein